MPERIKVSCESCGLMAKIESIDPLPPCDECGGTLVQETGTTPSTDSTGITDTAGTTDASDAAGATGAGQARRRERHGSTPYETPKSDTDTGAGRGEAIIRMTQAGYLLLAAIGILIALTGAAYKSGMLIILQLIAPVFFLLGVKFLRGQPFAWSVALATLLSLDLGLFLLFGGSSIGITSTKIGMVVLAWVAAALLFNANELIVANLRWTSSRRLRGRGRRPDRATASDASVTRDYRSLRATSKKVLVYSSFTFVATIGVIAGVIYANMPEPYRPPSAEEIQAMEQKAAQDKLAREESFQPVVAEFLRAWEGSDKSAIATMIGAGLERDRVLQRFNKTLGMWNFTDRLPKIDNRRDLWGRKNKDSVKCYWSIPETPPDRRAKLRTHWVLSEGRWRLIELRLAKTTRDD